MAGIGKTTLARDVYNDKAVEDFKFDIRAWVCVSDVFDVLSISKAILESINSKASDLNAINEVQIQLRKIVDGKKILLVLDDVWNKNYNKWEDLKAPFLNVAPKSKIIVTTRHSDVAATMALAEHYNLNRLSDEDCWSVFLKHAFEGRNINADRISEFRDKIVRKCGGLPLAAKALGGLLRSKRDDAWDGILNNNILDFSEENDILPVLKLSYHYLPSYLKRCFTYCAIFPKDYEFRKEELVLLWMAEGIIQQTKDDKQLEDWGSDCFDDLVSRSIFQRSSSDSLKFVMHGLVHDLAQVVSGETIFRLEDANKPSQKFQRIRHSSYNRDWFDGKNKFEVFYKFKYVRTFLPILSRGGYLSSYISYTILSDLLPKFKKLRVLSLKGYRITQLPISFKDLCLLRYLNLADTEIRYLPKSISSLLHLQILILRNCNYLIKLPPTLGNLISLRHLDIEGASLLKEIPCGMKQLQNLQKLSNFIVGERGRISHLKDLKNLKLLRGELCISDLQNLNDSQDAREAALCEKQNLEALSLEWRSQFDMLRDEAVDENVLDMLQPHKNIKRLKLRYYGGARFPFWIGDHSFFKMEVLTLENCENCKSLPSLSLLCSLKHLTIKGLTKLKSINSEFYGEDCSKSFQSLETLRFENLPELEHWENNVKEHEIVEIFLCLRELSIAECPKLYGRLPELLPSLEKLVVTKCAKLLVPVSSFPMLCKLKIDKCKGISCSSTQIDCKLIKCVTVSNSALDLEGWKGMLYNYSTESLRTMTVSNIFEFGMFLKQGFQLIETLVIGDSYISYMEAVQGLHIRTHIDEVSMEENCISLVSFPQVNFLCNNLRSLKIIDNTVLKSLPEEMMGNNSQLEKLYISNCDSLTFIAKCKLPSSLKSLEIWECKSLLRLVDNEDASSSSSSALRLKRIVIFLCPELTTLLSGIQSLMALESLHISYCPKLESLPDGMHNLNCLQRIYFWSCTSLVCFPERGLPSNILDVTIGICENLKSLPTSMHKLNSIRDLRIRECPSIVSFPKDGFSTSLTTLAIEDIKFYEAVNCGLHRFTSLTRINIFVRENNAESFPDEEIGMMLPNSLTQLTISGFQKLKCLSSMGFQNLTSLKCLDISDCPKLKSLPEPGLPSSLLLLYIRDSPWLKKQCKRGNGKEWFKISHIPYVSIDFKFIYDS